MITFTPYRSSSLGNFYTVTDGQTEVMLDCGLSWRKIRELLQFSTSGIAGILVSHSHLDHAKGIADAAKAGLDVYASSATFNNLKLTGHRFVNVFDNTPFSLGTWTVLPFATVHDAEGSLAFYMVNRENEAFLYLTDTAYSPVKFKDLSVVAAECNFQDDILIETILSGGNAALGRRIRRNHMSLEVLVELLKANDLSKCRAVYLLHLSSRNSDEAKMLREIQSVVGVPTYVCDE